LPGEVGKVVQLVTNNYSRRGPADTILQTLVTLKDADPALALPILDGLASGWPQGKAPDLKDADVAQLGAVMKALPEGARGSLLALAERWGRKEIFASESADIAQKLAGVLADAAQAPEARADAARRILILSDSPEHVEAILDQITSNSAPALNTALISALGESRQPATGGALIAHWKKFSPAARRVAVSTLMRRTEWSMALLNALHNKELPSGDLAADQWQQLKSDPEKEVSSLAKKIEKELGGATSADFEAQVQKLLPVTKETGNSAKGKEQFEKTCAVCHTLAGKGGKVGPELTGFGAHPKAEILIAIVDPNRSVEANFRLWSAKLKDGTLISGRLDSESQTSIEILDTNGQKHAIERKDIKILHTDNKSIMPEGFGTQLTPEDFKNLLEYISESKVK
jgi:putative heme-binding domain-containing protein